jgi:hypothetical protein
MQRYHRFIIFTFLLINTTAYASGVFVEGLYWRATETNNWAYINSLTVPTQTLNYKTIHFNYNPGVRVGAFYEIDNYDVLLAYTHFYTSTNDSATGNIQPSFIGSVTAKPSTAYLYSSGQVHQSINYNIVDFDFGASFHPTQTIMLHPIIGLIGGSIDQTINAQYQGTTSSNEKLVNNFRGIGPKFGVDAEISLGDCFTMQPKLFGSFATSYLLGYWNINDTTSVIPSRTVTVAGSNPRMGAITLQGAMGFTFAYKQWQAKIAYEIQDWRDQAQFFDNDTGAHNNDLILQGLVFGLTYRFT